MELEQVTPPMRPPPRSVVRGDIRAVARSQPRSEAVERRGYARRLRALIVRDAPKRLPPQDPYEILATMLREQSVPAPTDLDSAAVAQTAPYFRRFLFGQLTSAQLRAIIEGEAATTLLKRLTERYIPDTDKPTETSSLTRPELRFARVSDEDTQRLLDWNVRVVVKAYADMDDLLALLRGAISQVDTQALQRLFDIGCDMLVGATVANAFVTHFDRIVTPHFAYQLDWFLGPAIEQDALLPPGALVDTSRTMQYVVVERVDVTLGKFIELQSDTESVIVPTLSNLRALLAQLFYSLDAAWTTRGFLHYDLHEENIMVRALARETRSPYLGKNLGYNNGGSDKAFAIPPDEHEDLFAEVIDFGRARGYAPISDRPDETTFVLVGNPFLEEYGIRMLPPHADRSWDMRRLGFALLLAVDMDALEANTRRREPRLTDAAVRAGRAQFAHLVSVMANLPHLVFVLRDARDVFHAQLDARPPGPGYPNARACHAAIDDLAATADAIISDARLIRTLDARGDIAPARTRAELGANFIEMNVRVAAELHARVTSVLATAPNRSAVRYVLFNHVLFGALLSSSEWSGRHARLSAALCLYELPFFRPLFQYQAFLAQRNEPFINVGLVHASDVLTSQELEATVFTREPRAAKRAREPSASPPAGVPVKRARRIVFACLVCGHEATGVRFDIARNYATDEVFCSPLCLYAHSTEKACLK